MSSDADFDIEYVANLARIELTEEEKATFAQQLGDVLGYFAKLKEIDVEGVEPIAHAFPVYNVWNEDEAKETFTPAQALANAPAQRENQLSVPKVVDDA